MKTVYTIIIALLFTSSIFAQSVGINTDGSDPHNSAMLDVKSTTKGFLPPRMTTDEIVAIASPAAGLVVYNTTLNTMVFFNGTIWKRADGQFYIGASYGGGFVFYLDATGMHGLISAPSDQSTGTGWGCDGTTIGGTSTAIGTGQSNTNAIVTGCAAAGIAARICNDLVLNGYSDWFLPSKDELNLMYINLKLNGIGSFVANGYWSSSEIDFYNARFQNFSNGNQGPDTKAIPHYVRAVRAF